jgi:hypothetical protein
MFTNLLYSPNAKDSCLSSAGDFVGRAPFCRAKRRCIVSSRLLTSSGVPSGRPVCVHWRIALGSDSDSSTAKYPRQLVTSHRCCQDCIPNQHPVRSCHSAPLCSTNSIAPGQPPILRAPDSVRHGAMPPTDPTNRFEHEPPRFSTAASRDALHQRRSHELIEPRTKEIAENVPSVPAFSAPLGARRPAPGTLVPRSVSDSC